MFYSTFEHLFYYRCWKLTMRSTKLNYVSWSQRILLMYTPGPAEMTVPGTPTQTYYRSWPLRSSFLGEESSLNLTAKKYEGCLEIIETITILSKGLNAIQNNLYSHQVLRIWGLGLNYLTAIFNGYDPVAFLRLIPPLAWSTSDYADVHCTVLIYYCWNEQATINSFASKVYFYQ